MHNQFLFDGHGHSTASDGINNPKDILESAIHKNIQIIALTDHNTVSNLSTFIEQAKLINQQESKLLAIPGLELSCHEGDLLIYVPSPDNAQNLIQRFQKPAHRPTILESIEYYLENYDAYFVIPHPESFYISSVSLHHLEDILYRLSSTYRSHLGVEVFNWMSQIFLWRRKCEELKIRQFAKQHSLTMFGGTDYHRATDIGMGHTIMYMNNLDYPSFIEAFKHQRTQANHPHQITITELASIAYASGRAELNSTLFNRSFRIPKSA